MTFLFLHLLLSTVFAQERVIYDVKSTIRVSEFKNTLSPSLPKGVLLDRFDTSASAAIDLFVKGEQEFGSLQWLDCRRVNAVNGVTFCADEPRLYFTRDPLDNLITQFYIEENVDFDRSNTLFGLTTLLFKMKNQVTDMHEDTLYGRCKREVLNDHHNNEIELMTECQPNPEVSTHHPLDSMMSVLSIDYRRLIIRVNDRSSMTSNETFLIGAQGETIAVADSFMRLTKREIVKLTHNECESATTVNDCFEQLHLIKLGIDDWRSVLRFIQRRAHDTTQHDMLSNLETNLKEALLKIRDPNSQWPTKSIDFIELVDIASRTDQHTIAEILSDKSVKRHLNLLADVLAATESRAAFDAMLPLIGNNSLNHAVRYVQRLALNPHPTFWMTLELMDMIERTDLNPFMLDRIVLTYATLLWRTCTQSGRRCSHPDREKIDGFVTFIKRNLFNCTDDSTRALSCDVLFDSIYNLHFEQFTIEVANDFLCTTESKHRLRTLKILDSIGLYRWTDEIYASLERIAFDQCPSRALPNERSTAAQLLISAHKFKPNYTAKILRLVTRFNISSEVDNELATNLIAFINYRRQIDVDNLEEYYRAMVRAGDLTQNWDVNAVAGMSTSYAIRLAEYQSMALHVDYAGGSFRSVEMVLIDNEAFRFIGACIDVEGMSEWLGGVSDEREMRAGMGFELFGHRDRRLPFFYGSGELMSMAWGLDGTIMSALEGTLISSDQQYLIPLTAGGTLRLRSVIGLSADVRGGVDLSLWSQRADAKLKIRAGLGVQLRTSVEFSAVQNENNQLSMSTQVYVSGGVDMKMRLQFADEPYTLCARTGTAQLAAGRIRRQPAMSRQSKLVRARWHRQLSSPDVSFNTNAKLSAMCRDMGM